MWDFKETFSKDRPSHVHEPLNTFSLFDLGAGRAFCGPVDGQQASSPDCLTAQRAHRPVDTSGGKQHSARPIHTAYVSHSAAMCSRTSEWTRRRKKKTNPYLQQMFWVNERSAFFPRVSCGDSVVGCYSRKMSSVAPWNHRQLEDKKLSDEFNLPS